MALDDEMVAATQAGARDERPYSHLASMLDRRPPWHADALCREYPQVNWFPDQGESTEPAKLVCRSCLVRQDCANFAAETGNRVIGIWGGMSAKERRRRPA